MPNFTPLNAAMVSNFANGGAPYGVSIAGCSVEALGATLGAMKGGDTHAARLAGLSNDIPSHRSV